MLMPLLVYGFVFKLKRFLEVLAWLIALTTGALDLLIFFSPTPLWLIGVLALSAMFSIAVATSRRMIFLTWFALFGIVGFMVSLTFPKKDLLPPTVKVEEQKVAASQPPKRIIFEIMPEDSLACLPKKFRQ